MAACQHRPEDGCLMIPCASYINGQRRTCVCSEEVLAEIEAAKFGLETRVARVPDSARPTELGESA